MGAAPFSEDLAEGVREGDPDALGAVWRLLRPGLVRYLHTRVGDAGLAEDLAEDAFVDLVRSCRSIDGGAHAVRSWLYRAASRNLIDHHRGRGRRPEVLVARLPDHDDQATGPAQHAEARDLAASVQAILARLTPDQRRVLTLRFLVGLTAPEVAAVIGKPEGAVRSLQHRGAAAFARLADAAATARH